MLFPTFIFTVFFLVVWPLNWILMRRPGRWQALMLVSGYVFYSWWDWRFALLLAASTLANQLFAVQVSRARDPRRRKLIVTAAVATNLAVLGWFKYFNFFTTSAADLLHTVGVGWAAPTVTTVLPVGISFFTFMALSYVIDIYRGDVRTGPPLEVRGLPLLLPAPGRRADRRGLPNLSRSSSGRAIRAAIDASRAFFLIVGGLFKKVVISGYMASHRGSACSPRRSSHSALEVLVGIYAYAIQIYCGLQRLHRHGHRRSRCCSGFELPAELQPPLLGGGRCRTSGAAGT